jgi:hypothetical protein
LKKVECLDFLPPVPKREEGRMRGALPVRGSDASRAGAPPAPIPFFAAPADANMRASRAGGSGLRPGSPPATRDFRIVNARHRSLPRRAREEGGGAPAALRAGSLALALLAASPLVPAAPASAATDKIGDVELVWVWAYRTDPGAARGPIYAQDEVIADAVLETVDGGGLRAGLLDNSVLTLGSASRLVMDSMVYDAATRQGEAVVQLMVGVFRFVSGEMAKSGYRIETPKAIIGIRGTDVTIAVAADGGTRVWVAEGVATVTARLGGATVAAAAGQVASVDAAAPGVSLAAADPSAPPSLGIQGGGPGDPSGGADAGRLLPWAAFERMRMPSIMPRPPRLESPSAPARQPPGRYGR